MAFQNNPNVVSNGLVFSLDAGNVRSFQGIARTNFAKGVNFSVGENNSATYKSSTGTEVVDIPRLGKRTVKYIDHWNDYNGGSGQCCPNLFYYHTSGIYLSPSTTYTYSLVYKTTTGYTNANFMYRYEYDSNGTYLREGGVHSEANRIHLGNGWYYAWGQFTTQPTTAYMVGYLFYYQYATWDRIYIDRVSIVQGTTIPEPEHITVYDSANSGNIISLVGSNTGTLTNGPTYDSSNGGSIVLDGTNDYITVPSSNTFDFGIRDFTLEMWIYPQSFSTYLHMIALPDQGTFALKTNISTGEIYFYSPSFTTYPTTGWTLTLNTWNHVVFARQASVSYPYLNGVGYATKSGFTNNFSAQILNIHNGWPNEFAQCKIASTNIYNRALSAAEVQQNFNATRKRFGV